MELICIRVSNISYNIWRYIWH